MDLMVDNNKNGKTDLPIEFRNLHRPSAMPPQLMKAKSGWFYHSEEFGS
jgi:hypothetical protein